MTRNHNPVLQWAEEENLTRLRRDNSELLGAAGGNFWRSIWKRIEGSDSGSERLARVPEVTLEAPRDYVVKTNARPS